MTDPRDPELSSWLNKLANSATKLILSKVTARVKIPTIMRERFDRASPTSSGTAHHEEISWLGLVRRHQDLIMELPAYTSLMNYARQNDVVRAFVKRRFPAVQEWKQPSTVPFLFYTGFVEDYLTQAVRLAFASEQRISPPEELNELYAGAEAELYDEPATRRGFAPVFRLTLAAERLELSPNHRVRRIEDRDRDMWLCAVDPFGVARGIVPVFHTRFAIEVDQEMRRGEQEKLSQEVGRVVTVLGLFKAGGVAVPAIFQGWVDDWRRLPWWTGPFGATRAHMAGPSLTLSSDECQRLREFWAWYREQTKAHSAGRLLIALRRFSQAGDDAQPDEDRLIDSCIALEALLGPKDRRELSYRVGQRAAFLIGRDAAERESISRLLKATFGVRGPIVHGSKTARSRFNEFKKLESVRSLAELLDELLPLLAKLIRAWLSLPPKRRGDKELEQSILESGERLRPYFSRWVYGPSAQHRC